MGYVSAERSGRSGCRGSVRSRASALLKKAPRRSVVSTPLDAAAQSPGGSPPDPKIRNEVGLTSGVDLASPKSIRQIRLRNRRIEGFGSTMDHASVCGRSTRTTSGPITLSRIGPATGEIPQQRRQALAAGTDGRCLAGAVGARSNSRPAFIY
jgi:hypothetical protein